MKNNVIVFCLLFLSCLLFSCEYDSNPVFEESLISPPDEVELEIELSHVLPNNVIYIYEYTKLTYAINLEWEDVLSCNISIDADAYINGNNIYLYPLADNSVRKLIFEIQLKTNTGSIADRLGYEKCIGRHEYYVKFVKLEENFAANLRGGKSKEGYLQLNWDEAVFDNAKFQKYELTFHDGITGESISHTITDSKQTSFVDETYAWGYKSYELCTFYKNNDVGYEFSKTDYFTPEYFGFKNEPKFEYEYLDNEWMYVSWDYTGYKCKYLIVEANGTKNECDENQRKVKMQRFRFPADSNRFKLYILPFNMSYDDYERGVMIDCDYYWFNTGESYATPHAWDLSKNEFYNLYHDGLNIHSVSDFSWKSGFILREIDFFNKMSMSVSAKTSQIAIYKYTYPSPIEVSDIFVYNSNRFENPLQIRKVNLYSSPIYLCDNYTLFYNDQYLSGDIDCEGYCVVLDSKTGFEIFKQKLQNRDSQIAVSTDGKYLCDFYKAHLAIYQIQDNKAIQIYHYTNNDYRYSICQFSYTNPKELILGGGDEIVIFDVESLTSKNRMKGRFLVQDPVTGNMACLDENYSINSILNIYDENLSKKLARIPFNYFTPEPYTLFNNRLMFRGASPYRIDLSL